MFGSDWSGEFWDTAVLCSEIEKIPSANVKEIILTKKEKSNISKTGFICLNCRRGMNKDSVYCKYCGAMVSEDDSSNAETECGEWIPCGDGEHTPLMCSKCLNTWSFYKKRGSKHCPNCGKKMKEFKNV